MGDKLDKRAEIRICRIGTYPTRNSPGTGLPCYYLTRDIETPTLFLTRRVGGFIHVPEHVRFVAVDYPSPAFGERISISKAAMKVIGIAKFFLLSLPHLTSFKPDIIHIHSPLYLMHAAFARFVLGARVCMTFHGTDILRIKKSAVLRKLIRLIGDEFFYVSRAMEPVLGSFLPEEKLYYTPNGVDTERFKNLGLKREKLVVAVGSLRWQKGYEYLIEAFSMLKDKDYRLTIIGDGPLRDKIEELIEVRGLENRVTLAGRRNHEEIVRILNRASIYVLSSVTEGFPKALVEAMACGTAVVATDVGSCREIIRNAGIIVEPRNAEALYEALETLVGDEKLRDELSKRATKRAALFDWSNSTSTVYKIFAKLLGISRDLTRRSPLPGVKHAAAYEEPEKIHLH